MTECSSLQVCVSCLCHCCDKLSDNSTLKKEGRKGLLCVIVWEYASSQQRRQDTRWLLVTLCPLWEGATLNCFLSFIKFGALPTCRPVPHWGKPCRHIHTWVSAVALNPMELTRTGNAYKMFTSFNSHNFALQTGVWKTRQWPFTVFPLTWFCFEPCLCHGFLSYLIPRCTSGAFLSIINVDMQVRGSQASRRWGTLWPWLSNTMELLI